MKTKTKETGLTVNPKQAIDYIFRCLRVNLVPMLSGSPGCGKSDIGKQIAKENNLELIDIRLSTIDPLDLTGALKVGDTKASWVPLDVFPLADATLPKGKAGWLIFMDEMNAAPLSVQNAAYRVLLDKEIGQYALHPNVAMMAAGNLSTDGAIVNRTGTAMQSRLVHLQLEVSIRHWLEWAIANGIDHRIMAYLEQTPQHLQDFDPRHNDKTFSCPRTWFFLSKLIKNVPVSKLHELLPLLAGTVGQGVANQFVAHTSVYSKIPTYDKLVAKPHYAYVGSDPAERFATAYMIPPYFEKKDLVPVLDYLDRLPPEFRVIALQGIWKKDPSVRQEKVMRDWTTLNGQEMF